jgi:hypothetical protein
MAETRSVALLISGNLGWTDNRNALAATPRITVVADVASVDELLPVAARKRPDTIIMPARIGEASLIPLLQQLQQMCLVC